MYGTSSYAVILQGTAPVLQSVAPGSPGNRPVLQRIFAAKPTLATPRLLFCMDARKPPVIRGFGSVCSYFTLPLNRRSG